MAQNITLMGASYSDVPAVELPKTGGGTALFADPSGVTAAAADVASGKYFLDANGDLVAGTASGGGGASNIVTGTFKGTTSGAAMDVTIPYTGNGYPVAVEIYPTEGPYNSTQGTFYSLVQRYAISWFAAIKRQMNTAPDYVNDSYSAAKENNAFEMAWRYKSSASGATSYGGSTVYFNLCRKANATNTASNFVRMKSATTMSVYIAPTSYGFAANIEYTYVIRYSS